MKNKKVQIVIPCYNEERNIPLIYNRIKSVTENFTKEMISFELLFINDGSNDNTLDEIKKLVNIDNKVFFIDFSRNFGHHAALDAGVSYSDSDAIIMIDADLQQPPELIPQIIDKWISGFEIVNTKRIDGENVGLFKRVTAGIFYHFFNKFSSIHIDPGSADFRLLDSKVVKEIKKFPEKEKFFRGIVNWVGFKTYSIDYQVGKRIHGSSSYSFKKMLVLAKIGILSFSMFPVKLVIVLGVIFFFIGLVFLLNFLISVTFGDTIFSVLDLVIYLLLMSAGIIILVLGIITVYLFSIFKQIENRPSYIIREKNIE